MSYFATCAGLQIVGGALLMPSVGLWTADLQFADAQAVTGPVQVVIGNLTLQGFVYRADVYGGQVRARLVGGAGGWRTRIAAQGYGSGQGVKLSTVLQDAAAACGEQVSIAVDATIGQAFVRVAFGSSVASDVLWQMLLLGYIGAWYVAPSGVTQTAPWPSTTISTPFDVTDQRPDEGVIVVATEDYASWMPGCTFSSPLLEGSYTSSGVQYVWTDDGTFRLEVLTGTTGDRVLGPLQQIVEKQIAPLRFFGRYAYTISNPSSTTIDGSPNDSMLGLPDVQNVPITADSIASYTPAAGAVAHVMFVDGDPTQPVCVWTAQTPTQANVLSGSNPIARLGDQIQAFLPPTLPVVGTVSGNPFAGTITVVNPISGVITQGSAQVNSA
jgi:hypothetical protein